MFTWFARNYVYKLALVSSQPQIPRQTSETSAILVRALHLHSFPWLVSFIEPFGPFLRERNVKIRLYVLSVPHFEIK
jgi:hypothetical protein